MMRIPIGQRIFLSIIAIFLLFAVAFIVFQQWREKEYKIELLNTRLQDYNNSMEESLRMDRKYNEAEIEQHVSRHPLQHLRVTIVDTAGHVLYDNLRKDYTRMGNHLGRKEIQEALRKGTGNDIDRISSTLNKEYFYSATYYPKQHFIIRTALPYDNELTVSLRTDQHFIWFALAVMLILVLVLYRFTHRLGDNITKLRLFASQADQNGSIETEDLIKFPNDELGEIAERIVKIYMQLQRTREEQNVIKRQLTQNIAHELKTPVASIQGYLETIINTPDIDESTKAQFIERSYVHTQRLAALLQDISTINRMDDAPDMRHFERVNISLIVSQIVRETTLQLAERGMIFNNRLPDNIEVEGNPSLLYSTFRNLTDNAIAHAGAQTTITLTAAEDATYWHFTFSDNGYGVPAEHLPRLFERFYRVDKGRSRKLGGTGLGLAIVKNAVLLHRGTISVANNEDGGLRFDFSLRK